VQFNDGVCKKIELAEKEGAQCTKNSLSDSQMCFPQSWKLTLGQFFFLGGEGGLAPQTPDMHHLC